MDTYMRSGSLAGTADAFVCHRTTILERIARFKELTGLDPAVPWDAATIRIGFAVPPQGTARSDDAD
ncbi:helix-turn-helix domain-containing protein [Rhodococcus koreensis]|uniref:helix-turn-helix domain-containing protein n=1 Tax=Rhodococcus koreensis TaxID=99653 RepID=UPI003B847178